MSALGDHRSLEAPLQNDRRNDWGVHAWSHSERVMAPAIRETGRRGAKNDRSGDANAPC